MKTFSRKYLLPVAVLVVVVGLVAVLRVAVPMYTIGSGSMDPTLPVGTRVFLGSADDLELYDIITFQQEGAAEPTTHTFIGYDQDGNLLTKGDANPTPDVHTPPLTEDDVIGKVVLQTPILAPSFWLSQKGIGIGILIVVGIGALIFGFRESSNDNSKQSNPSDTSSVTTPA